jgi:hypothetical protein
MICRLLLARPGPFLHPLSVGIIAAAGALGAAAQEPRTEYRMSLTDVYGVYQSILARREACNSAFAPARPGIEKAYSAWHTRHRKLLDELDQRFNMMIRSASKDDKDYARNVGKYEGALLRQREEAKQALLQQPRLDLELECKSLPDFLLSSESDIEKNFAEQLQLLRKRPLSSK